MIPHGKSSISGAFRTVELVPTTSVLMDEEKGLCEDMGNDSVPI